MNRIISRTQTLITIAVASAVFFVVGGMLTATTGSSRAVLTAAGVAIAALGLAALLLHIRATTLRDEREELRTEIRRLRTEDEALRTRMVYTLRDPLASIVGFADRMSEDAAVGFDERRTLLIAIRDNAREVEQSLADLAQSHEAPVGARVDGVVLLHEEARSVASAIWSEADFVGDFKDAKAWGDSARVRQILRTAINAAHDSGCAFITIATEQRRTASVVTISGRDDLLPIQAIAALTGNTEVSDITDEAYIALRTAHDLAGEMGGTIGYAQAFGVAHIVIEFPPAPEDISLQSIKPKPVARLEPSIGQAVALRPERPTTAIRFS